MLGLREQRGFTIVEVMVAVAGESDQPAPSHEANSLASAA